jgi:hypothetical protein
MTLNESRQMMRIKRKYRTLTVLSVLGTELDVGPHVVRFQVRLLFKQSLKQICFCREVINLMDCFMVLCFMVSSAVHVEKSVHDLLTVSGSCKLQ